MSISEDYMTNITNKINEMFENEEWDKAEAMLLDEVMQFPEEWWPYVKLSQINKNIRQYDKAYEYSRRAFEINPEDYLCIYEYAESLLRNDETEKAIILLKKIQKKGLKGIVYGKYGEGLRLGKPYYNDTIALLGYAYYDLKDNKKARYYFKRHLKSRKRGIYSDFTKKQIEKALEKCG